MGKGEKLLADCFIAVVQRVTPKAIPGPRPGSRVSLLLPGYEGNVTGRGV
jgi:hypothetical protein